MDESVLPVTEKERRREGNKSIWSKRLKVSMSIFCPRANTLIKKQKHTTYVMFTLEIIDKGKEEGSHFRSIKEVDCVSVCVCVCVCVCV